MTDNRPPIDCTHLWLPIHQGMGLCRMRSIDPIFN
jgi:hypothetical protein